MIEYRPLTAEERMSPTHFCNRCETTQKRFEIHHCVATERWKAAKTAMAATREMLAPSGVTTVHLTENQREIVPENSTLASEEGEIDESDARNCVFRRAEHLPFSGKT
jgi:hypothetical protein